MTPRTISVRWEADFTLPEVADQFIPDILGFYYFLTPAFSASMSLFFFLNSTEKMWFIEWTSNPQQLYKGKKKTCFICPSCFQMLIKTWIYTTFYFCFLFFYAHTSTFKGKTRVSLHKPRVVVEVNDRLVAPFHTDGAALSSYVICHFKIIYYVAAKHPNGVCTCFLVPSFK